MKKCCIIFLLSIIISLTALGFSGILQNNGGRYELNTATTEQSRYLRMHIRADSNEEKAQSVKYYVRDKLVEFLTPLVASYQTKEQALDGVQRNISTLSAVATRALRDRGFSYGATAELTKESFPTRVYDGYTLPAGEYTALIVRLGRGQGDNWWCVVYPPLCFSAPQGENVIYKSKIKEIIERF